MCSINSVLFNKKNMSWKKISHRLPGERRKAFRIYTDASFDRQNKVPWAGFFCNGLFKGKVEEAVGSNFDGKILGIYEAIKALGQRLAH